ncbi:MAG: ABC transporter related protein [Berkelbacteria bacterium GW2011_GWB1_38_5]|uniref:ABC transporter related protein n=1 Tax=Berkelbacteria bacterium GW2011_GWB1_38_5 TaxID=1618336 RepID=A0A0G0MIR6_9BACT|nr:MAG: ABC transporter related protein [Berkelbacteria bacterium GW2011_GWB1_38_5]
MIEKVIEIKNLTKKYGKLIAVNDISFDVQKGEVFGLLGENGAGKTTTMEMIESLRKPSSGSIKVLGDDVSKNSEKVKEKIGVQLQSSAYYDYLKLREILELFGGFYEKNADPDKLFRMVDLEDKTNAYIKNLSGGQKQRFSIIASLINDPEVIFLDEPTTGLDPIARRNTWEIISEIKKQGKTIIMTTHYMEEAEFLCDRVAIMEKGKIIALDKPHKLIERTENPYKITFILQKDNQNFLNKLINACGAKNCLLKKLPGKDAHYEINIKQQEVLNKALLLVEAEKPESLQVGQATLEDLFIELTGKTITDEENGD